VTDEILEEARTRVLADIDAALARDWNNIRLCSTLERERKIILQSDWQPSRPPRRMPSLWAIASYWDERDTFGDIPLDAAPFCFGCRKHAGWWGLPACEARWNDASCFLDRAHLITRDKGGLDGPQNLVPLCERCHKTMPFFGVGDECDAIEWVRAGGRFATPGVLEMEVAALEARYAAARDEARAEAAMALGGQYSLW